MHDSVHDARQAHTSDAEKKARGNDGVVAEDTLLRHLPATRRIEDDHRVLAGAKRVAVCNPRPELDCMARAQNDRREVSLQKGRKKSWNGIAKGDAPAGHVRSLPAHTKGTQPRMKMIVSSGVMPRGSKVGVTAVLVAASVTASATCGGSSECSTPTAAAGAPSDGRRIGQGQVAETCGREVRVAGARRRGGAPDVAHQSRASPRHAQFDDRAHHICDHWPRKRDHLQRKAPQRHVRKAAARSRRWHPAAKHAPGRKGWKILSCGYFAEAATALAERRDKSCLLYTSPSPRDS